MKMFTPRIVAAFTAALLLALAAPAAESLSVLLQKGIYAEETERDLDAAIKIYEQIANESAANRPLAAQAQYRLAACYQKQGKKEQAIALLKEIVRQYPADAAFLAKAQEQLLALGHAAPEAVGLRQIPVPGAGWFIAVSPDGRFLAYMPKDTEDVVIHDLGSGKNRATIKCEKGKSPSGWISAIFSPDGRWLGFDLNETGIAVARTDGSETKTVFEQRPVGERKKGDGIWVTMIGWSGDSTRVLFTTWDKGCNCRVLFSADVRTGEVIELMRPSDVGWERGTVLWRLSHNGAYIARVAGLAPRRIHLLNLATKREEVIATRDHVTVDDDGSLLGWAMGDTKLLFTEYRGTEVDIWALPIRDGKKSGEPELVLRNIRSLLPTGDLLRAGVTRQGSIYYSTYERPERSLWVIEGFVSRKPPTHHNTDIPVDYLVAPGNALQDRKYGVSATLPPTWVIRSATHNVITTGTESVSISLAAPEVKRGTVHLNYFRRFNHDFAAAAARQPPSSAQIAAQLQILAQGLAANYARTYREFRYRPASLAVRTAGGNTVFSGVADYSSNDEPRVSCFSTHYSASVRANMTMNVHRDDFEPAFAAFRQFVDSLKLSDDAQPPPRKDLGLTIALEEVLRADNTVFDQQTGVALTVPRGWEPFHSGRTTERTNEPQVKFLVSLTNTQSPAAMVRLTYFVPDELKPAPSDGVQGRLRRWAENIAESQKKQSLFSTNYAVRPSTMTFREVGGRPAATWIVDYAAAGEPYAQYGTLIHGEAGNAWVRMTAPAAEIETLRAGYEELIASIRVP